MRRTVTETVTKTVAKKALLIGSAMACMALGACSQEGDYNDLTEASSEMAGEGAMADVEAGAEAVSETTAANEPIRDESFTPPPTQPDVTIALPRMSYVHDYGFRLEAEGIAELQERHADMCAAAGPYVCQIVAQSRSGNAEDEYATGRLELAVVADQARYFGSRLSSAAESVGGEQVTSAITGEDLTKNMIDTEARLRTRVALRDRMMEVLRTRQGSVEEIVEAERSVAAINEEIDQARSWMEEMRQRVAFTRINIDYSTASAPASDFLGPVGAAVSSIGSILGLPAGDCHLAGIGGLADCGRDLRPTLGEGTAGKACG